MKFRPVWLPMTLPLLALLGWQSQEEAKKPAEPLKLPPRAYYRDHCQRCHGVDGCNFIPGYAKKEPIEKLRADVKRMAEGAGEAPLKDSDIDVQTAYAWLASEGKPFISWTGRDGRTLSGEVSDGATLTAKVADKEIKVELDDDFQWKLTLEKADDIKQLKLTAKIEKATVTLAPYEHAYVDRPKNQKP